MFVEDKSDGEWPRWYDWFKHWLEPIVVSFGPEKNYVVLPHENTKARPTTSE